VTDLCAKAFVNLGRKILPLCHNMIKTVLMKKLIYFVLVAVAVVFFGCSNDNNAGSGNAAGQAGTATAAVLHYTCPNNCAGSGGDVADVCPVCGTAYVHNAAFHANDPIDASTPVDPATLSGGNSGVPHYICSAGCGGGGAAAGSCPNCGAELAHNQAFHNTPGSPAAPTMTAPANTTISPIFQNGNATTTMPSPVPPPPSPAQNAAGLFHYTCSAGCGGGGGAAGSCPNCGAALAHNQAYHN